MKKFDVFPAKLRLRAQETPTRRSKKAVRNHRQCTDPTTSINVENAYPAGRKRRNGGVVLAERQRNFGRNVWRFRQNHEAEERPAFRPTIDEEGKNVIEESVDSEKYP